MRTHDLSLDARLLFASRGIRMFGYGLVSVVLVLYLAALGLSDAIIGVLLTLTLLGDAAISLWLTTHADRVGRRRVLLAGAGLMFAAGLGFAASPWLPLLAVSATLGVISPSGNEVGPFLAVEQAALSETTEFAHRTAVLAWFNLTGLLATAGGALLGGVVPAALIGGGSSALDAYRAVILGYSVVGVALLGLLSRVSSGIEVRRGDPASAPHQRLGLGRSQRVVAHLAALFALDAFGGGFVVQSLIAYWFSIRFGADPAVIGATLFVANLVAGLSSLAAARIAARIGLIRTMVFTHLPSSVLLILLPFMPTLPLAILVLVARYSVSKMDVPTRQSYTMAVVEPDERSAAAGVTGIARNLGAAIAPLAAAPLIGSAALAAVPFVLAGAIKISYDLLLFRAFRGLRESS